MVARLLAVGLVALAAGCAGGSDPELSLPPGASFTATGTMTPRTIAFGDQLTARLRILVDRNRIDPGRIRVLARFSPWRDQTTVERTDAGDVTALVYTIRLDCLTISCVPAERELTTNFAAARIVSDVGPVQEVEWPEVAVVTRVSLEDPFVPENTGEELEQWPPAWRAAVSVPEASYRFSPTVLTWLLAGLGALLLAASAAAGWQLLRRGRLVRTRVVAPLDRALELLRSARTNEERRAALEALALALDLEPELSEPARALAWSERTPSDAAAQELAALAKGSSR